MSADTPPFITRLLIARHAPVAQPGLAGRRDVAADCGDCAALRWLAGQLRAPTVLCSPALRCRQTSAAMGFQPRHIDALWEQDFGAWEPGGAPDLGPMSAAQIAVLCPPGGESFADMAARVQPVLEAARGTTAIIAHAGTVRAALALAVGPAALSFIIAPLSLTIMTRGSGGWAIEAVNRLAP